MGGASWHHGDCFLKQVRGNSQLLLVCQKDAHPDEDNCARAFAAAGVPGTDMAPVECAMPYQHRCSAVGTTIAPSLRNDVYHLDGSTKAATDRHRPGQRTGAVVPTGPQPAPLTICVGSLAPRYTQHLQQLALCQFPLNQTTVLHGATFILAALDYAARPRVAEKITCAAQTSPKDGDLLVHSQCIRAVGMR
jgi:hypothetical protein